MLKKILVRGPIVAALVILQSLSACNNFLEVKPDKYVVSTESYYKTEEQLDIALRGVYAVLAETFVYGNSLLGRMGLEADEGFMHFPTDNGTIGYYVVNTTDDKLLNHWRALYRGVSRANSLLKNMDQAGPQVSEEKRKEIKGQALFLRGYYYFLLVSRFGGVPMPLDPPVSSENEVLQLKRTNIKEVYVQVLSDMEQAETMVKDINTVESAGRVSKSAVWAVLARVNLYMAGYPLAEKERYATAAQWAKKVIDLGFHRLNPSYEEVFVNYAQDKYDSKESIWEVEFWGNGTGVYNVTGGSVGINNGIAYSATGTLGFGFSQGMVRPHPWLYRLYDADDKRRDWAIAPYRYGTAGKESFPPTSLLIERFCGKFRRENELVLPKTNTQTPQNFPLVRYADVLLMAAEGINESENSATHALPYLNKVRRRAKGIDVEGGNVSVDLTGLSSEQLRSEIKNERARELCFEALRKNDLIRWGDFYEKMKNRLSEVPTGTNTLYTSMYNYYNNARERDVIWPIPSYEMGVNPKLEQNPGW
ncbi:RagB/SusD family nutrient uptake outer membrane protein [Sphingobacterium psychroaquaticum]|uniref:RagB/SusD family nutrient uptake outer membrane protein n=1 Tax=Sphingobacterium psychroaquaticum TaxID=561061 RepID=UPI0010695AB3|nr:RagB/SusD family nutrient uptake outer membrane protein [Sphingobacterium psychroaquaticum]QBQ40649.1 RagB/SusD family nutrient uptake outer membrane protein [Sphingobacterium psychroaquaticum]